MSVEERGGTRGHIPEKTVKKRVAWKKGQPRGLVPGDARAVLAAAGAGHLERHEVPIRRWRFGSIDVMFRPLNIHGATRFPCSQYAIPHIVTANRAMC